MRFVRSGTAALTLPDIALAPNESRDFAEECYLDTGRGWLPGAYVVRADITHDQGLNVYATATTHIYVQAGADGHPRVFPGRPEYKQVYEDGYKAGKNGIFYQIVLDEGPYPQAGTLYLRVREEIHTFAPAVDVKSVGAFQFRAGQLPAHVNGRLLSNNAVEFVLQPIWSGGERILALPFVLEAGCMGGIYRLEVVKLNGAGGSLRWVDFQRTVTNKNPQLLADGGTLYPDKLYWLPDPAVDW